MKKNIWIHVGMIAAMFIIACAYFTPALEGKVIRQGDIQKFEAMAHMQREAKKEIGYTPSWAPSMFSGMPGYQITNDPQHSVFNPAKTILNLDII